MDAKTRTELDAAVMQRLLNHLDSRRDVQNIELMILAGFCRNCLSKWYREEALARGVDVELPEAQQRIYGMSYDDWKAKYQLPATAEQLARFEAARPAD